MICALAIPAYRQTVSVQSAYAWQQDALSCIELGWQPFPIWVDNSGIPRARNTIVKVAEDKGARLLLTMDADTFPMVPEGGLKHMWQVMQQHRAAVVGAAVVTRNGTRVNCEPSKPGECYPGEVGTGYMLIDLWKLRELPKPWFVQQDTADGLGVSVGEDIGFCRAVSAAGHTVIVNYELPMGHGYSQVAATFA